MIDKNTLALTIDNEHRIYRTKVGMFLDINEVKVDVDGNLVCRHSIEEIGGDWFLKHRNGAGKPFLISKAISSRELAEEQLFNVRLQDIDELYIRGHRPTFFLDYGPLADYIFTEFDAHIQSKIVHIHTGEVGYMVREELAFKVGKGKLEHNLANYEQAVLIQNELKEHNPELADLPEQVQLDGKEVYQYSKMREQLFVHNDKLHFQGLFVDVEYPKVSIKPSGPLFQRGIEAGMTVDEAEKLYQMGYRMLELAITRI